MDASHFGSLIEKITNKSATVGVIGLGYVGLPLAVTASKRGFTTVGFDVDPQKIERLERRDSYIEVVTSSDLESTLSSGTFRATADFSELSGCNVIVICVPTPLNRHREPDLSYVTKTAETIAANLTAGTLVSLESTTFPGTTSQVLMPILETAGLTNGVDLFIGFSPEREDPGNASFRTATIPKIVAGEGEEAGKLMVAFYENVVDQVVPTSSTKVAEAVKITENIFRAVNIALVNEMKVIYDAMGIDVWEVIDGAATKPFGFMPFYPGPGLGGHCIPIDPFYLTWKAREFGLSTRFIELAGEINVRMPDYVVTRLRDTLDSAQKVSLSAARVLIIGLAYKKNVSDVRESPSFRLIKLLSDHGTAVDYHDPFVPTVPQMREYPEFLGKKSVSLEGLKQDDYHAILISTDHDAVDYKALTELGVPIIDTRNAISRRNLDMANVVKA